MHLSKGRRNDNFLEQQYFRSNKRYHETFHFKFIIFGTLWQYKIPILCEMTDVLLLLVLFVSFESLNTWVADEDTEPCHRHFFAYFVTITHLVNSYDREDSSG